ncbi:TlpA family protein disulfide reductase [Candidatus Acetothermia bacterium]|nr:TlpA family protein disulfide reductase [Candidatus Acetothermia bacterium]
MVRAILMAFTVFGICISVGFTSWADLIVSANTDDRKAFERILENSTGLDISIDGSGKISLVGGVTPVGKTKFTELLRGVINDSAVTVRLVVGRNLENILIGSFEGESQQLLDLDDIEKFETEGTKGLSTQASKVIHEVREAYEGKKNKLSYDEAHKRAIDAENAVLKDQNAGKRTAAREECQFPNGAGDFRLFLGWSLSDGTAGFEKYEGKVELRENKRFVQLAKISFVKTKSLAFSGTTPAQSGDVSPICLYEEVSKEKAGAIAVPGVDPSKVGIELGQFAPNFLLSVYQGGLLRLSNLRGRKVIVNFWASWCGPCVAEMPDLQSVVHESRKGKILLLGLNMGETEDDVEIFLKQNVHVSYPLLLDSNPPFEVTRAYKIFTQPSSFFIDERGLIVYQKSGAFTKEELEQAVSDFEKK